MIAVTAEGIPIALSAKLSSFNGEIIWDNDIEIEDVYKRTVSMSQMTSMLKDRYRNTVYQEAIDSSIRYFHDKYQRKPKVLE